MSSARISSQLSRVASDSSSVVSLKFSDSQIARPSVDSDIVRQNRKRQRQDDKSRSRPHSADSSRGDRFNGSKSFSRSSSANSHKNKSSKQSKSPSKPPSSHGSAVNADSSNDLSGLTSLHGRRDSEVNKKPKYSEEEMKAFNQQEKRVKQRVDELKRAPSLKKSELEAVKSLKLKNSLRRIDRENKELAESAARAEILLTNTSGSLHIQGSGDGYGGVGPVDSDDDDERAKTWRIQQRHIVEKVGAAVAKKKFDLKLDKFGPYTVNYTRNGRHLLLGGGRGHIAALKWEDYKLGVEMNVNERIQDVQWLHNEQMFAVAQQKYVYIYDSQGVELHCLRRQNDVLKLDFLPYHFLLVSVNGSGWLRYQDTSTGELVSEHRTKMGPCRAMAQNPSNAVMHLGHGNGQITLWTPNMNEAVVKIQAHRSNILSLAVDLSGRYMVSAGLDGQMKVWDIRRFQSINDYFTVKPAQTMDISDRGMVALGFGSHVQVWQNLFSQRQNGPYLVENYPGKIVNSVEFCPYEDVLGVGHDQGFSSILIPGAGEANFDSYEANVYQTRQQRREHTVHQLLDKLQPDMITLDAGLVGLMDSESKTVFEGERKELREAREREERESQLSRNRMRGKNSTSKRTRRRRANIVEQQHEERKIEIQKQMENEERRKAEAERIAAGIPKSALDRFSK